MKLGFKKPGRSKAAISKHLSLHKINAFIIFNSDICATLRAENISVSSSLIKYLEQFTVVVSATAGTLKIWHLSYLIGNMQAKNSSYKYNLCKCLLI